MDQSASVNRGEPHANLQVKLPSQVVIVHRLGLGLPRRIRLLEEVSDIAAGTKCQLHVQKLIADLTPREYVDDKLRAWTFTRSGKARQYVSKMWANGVPKPTRPDLCSLQFRTRSSDMPPEAGANYEVRCSLARKLRMPGSGRWHAVPPKDAAPGQDTTAASFDDDDYGRQLELGDDGHLRLRLFAKEGLLR